MATPQLIIGNKNYSSWSLRPWLLLATHGIAFEEIRIPLSREDTRARIDRYTPAGKVPVLIDGDTSVWDSLAICEYISERWLDGAGWPENAAARAESRAVSAEMHSGFQALRTEMPMNCRATRTVQPSSAAQQDIRRIDAIWSSLLERNMRTGVWLFGGFSIADCMFAPVVLRFQTYGTHISPSGHAYMETMLAHAPIRDWIRAARAETEVITENEAGT